MLDPVIYFEALENYAYWHIQCQTSLTNMAIIQQTLFIAVTHRYEHIFYRPCRMITVPSKPVCTCVVSLRSNLLSLDAANPVENSQSRVSGTKMITGCYLVLIHTALLILLLVYRILAFVPSLTSLYNCPSASLGSFFPIGAITVLKLNHNRLYLREDVILCCCVLA